MATQKQSYQSEWERWICDWIDHSLQFTEVHAVGPDVYNVGDRLVGNHFKEPNSGCSRCGSGDGGRRVIQYFKTTAR